MAVLVYEICGGSGTGPISEIVGSGDLGDGYLPVAGRRSGGHRPQKAKKDVKLLFKC